MSINCVTNQVEIRIGLFLEWGYGDTDLFFGVQYESHDRAAPAALDLPSQKANFP